MMKKIKAVFEPEYLSVADAERLSGRSRWAWRKDAYSQRVESVKIGTKLLIPVREVRRVMEENTRPRVVSDSGVAG